MDDFRVVPRMVTNYANSPMAYILNVAEDDRCAMLELRFFQCKNAYGEHMSKSMCEEYRSDYHECVRPLKRLQRRYILRRELKKALKDGRLKEEDLVVPAGVSGNIAD